MTETQGQRKRHAETHRDIDIDRDIDRDRKVLASFQTSNGRKKAMCLLRKTEGGEETATETETA